MELTNDVGFIKASDVDTSQNHIHSNKTVLDKITQNSLDVWNDGVRRIAFVGSDTDNSNGWYKVAEQTCSGYGDTNITFMVTSTYSNYNVGILQLQIRSDSSSISCRTLKWLTRIGFNVNHYVVVINGMKWTLYANQPSNRYGRIAFEILSMSSIDKKNISEDIIQKLDRGELLTEEEKNKIMPQKDLGGERNTSEEYLSKREQDEKLNREKEFNSDLEKRISLEKELYEIIAKINSENSLATEKEIKEINYLDPFGVKKEW